MGEYAFVAGAPTEWIDRYHLNDPDFHRRFMARANPRFVILSGKLDFAWEYYALEKITPSVKSDLSRRLREKLESDYTLLTDMEDFGWWQERVEVYIRNED